MSALRETFEKGDFKPSIIWLVTKYKYFNKRYFKNELPNFNIFNFRISSARNFFGCSRISFYKENDKLIPVEDSSIVEISDKFFLDEISYENVLLHEMIHVYQGFILGIWPEHDDTFKNKMEELEKMGRNVPMFEDPEDYEMREKKKMKKEMTSEEIKAFSLLFQDPKIIREWVDENGKECIEIVVT